MTVEGGCQNIIVAISGIMNIIKHMNLTSY